ncbi:segregation and condensation protein A [Mycoplasma sp. CAG:776]|nr:segregation and condensation protein A [Mycoplasma sp. CAG:776]
MEYKFSINDFEGPLDLLLHLVKTSKMNIYEIDIKIIIEEYLKFIEEEKHRNIDIASSYLVMASELIHLKSKMLVHDEEKEEISDDEFSIESEEDLKRKIIEYEKYKKLSESLVELENKRNNFYTKSPMNLNAFLEKGNINFGDVHLEDLVDALKKLKEREKYNKPLNTKVTKKEYSIERRIEDIRKILQVRDKVEFLELFSEPNRDFLIVTFLSILTMSKNDEITLTQEDNFKPILIERSNIHE